MSGNQKIGYARVSTDDQNLHLQRDALGAAGCQVIYEETASGRKFNRVELGHCLKALRPGDTLVVWRLDRLGRSTSELIKIVNALGELQIHFKSLHEELDTGSATGKLIFHIFAALAEFERNLISERTKAGLAAAKARGRVGGRRPKMDAGQAKEITALLEAGTPASKVAKRYGISRTTLYKYVGGYRPWEQPGAELVAA